MLRWQVLYLPATPVFGSRCLANIAHAQSILQAEVQDRFGKITETKQKQKQKQKQKKTRTKKQTQGAWPHEFITYFILFFLAVNEDPIIIDYATHKNNYLFSVITTALWTRASHELS